MDERTFLLYFLWLWICNYCSWVYLWATKAFTRDDLLVTSGRAVPVLSLTVFPLPEGSSKEWSLLQLAWSAQHGISPPGSVKQLQDDGGKKCSLTVLAFLCIRNKSFSPENRKEQVHWGCWSGYGVASSALLCAFSFLRSGVAEVLLK